MFRFPTTITNIPARKGELATAKFQFGDHGRYAVAAVHTRFDAVEWFVWDAETDDAGLPAVIRQAATLEAALRGLFTGLVPLGETGKHDYEIDAGQGLRVDVWAANRTQAAARARAAGFEVMSCNMMG